jgi:hypothetical protein
MNPDLEQLNSTMQRLGATRTVAGHMHRDLDEELPEGRRLSVLPASSARTCYYRVWEDREIGSLETVGVPD